MKNGPIELTVAAFSTPEAAGRAMDELNLARREGLIGIEDMAIIVKDANGKTRITNSKHRTARGFLTGGVIGGVVALLAGPVGWGAALGGGALGALAGRIRNHPIKTALNNIGESLIPNSSAIVAVIEHTWVADIERGLAAKGARIVHETLQADITEQLEAGGNVLYSAMATDTGAGAVRATESKDKATIGGFASGQEGVFVENATLTNEKVPSGPAAATGAGTGMREEARREAARR